eukprot:gene22597-66334_t
MRRVHSVAAQKTRIVKTFLRDVTSTAQMKKHIHLYMQNIRKAQRATRRLLARRAAQRDLLLLQFNATEERMISGVKNVTGDSEANPGATQITTGGW